MVVLVMNGAIDRISRWELAYLRMIEVIFKLQPQRIFICFTHMDKVKKTIS
jgi:hypothetical protein